MCTTLQAWSIYEEKLNIYLFLFGYEQVLDLADARLSYYFTV